MSTLPSGGHTVSGTRAAFLMLCLVRRTWNVERVRLMQVKVTFITRENSVYTEAPVEGLIWRL